MKRGLALAALAALAACAPRFVPPGEAVQPPALTDGHFHARDGARLPLRRWRPDGKPRAVVLALHGYTEYSAALDGPGAWLAGRGIAVYAYDQRGFGRAPHPGRWAGRRAYVRDAVAAAEALAGRYPDTPLYVLGESMGAAVVLAAAPDLRGTAAGLVLVAPGVWGWSTLPWPHRVGLTLAAHSVPWLRLSGRGLDIRPSDNTAMLRALAADPLVQKRVRVDTLYGTVNLMDAGFRAAKRLKPPALVLYGAGDAVIPPYAVKRLLDRMPDSRTRFAYYATGFHMLLRDLNRHRVLGDIAAWLGDRTGPLPSGAGDGARQRLAQAVE